MHNEFFLVVLRKQKNCDEGGLYELLSIWGVWL